MRKRIRSDQKRLCMKWLCGCSSNELSDENATSLQDDDTCHPDESARKGPSASIRIGAERRFTPLGYAPLREQHDNLAKLTVEHYDPRKIAGAKPCPNPAVSALKHLQ